MDQICLCPEPGLSWPAWPPAAHILTSGRDPEQSRAMPGTSRDQPELTRTRAFTRARVPRHRPYRPYSINRVIIRLFGWTLNTMGDGGDASRYPPSACHDAETWFIPVWYFCDAAHCYQLLSFGLINRFKEKDYLNDLQNVIRVSWSADLSVRSKRY